MKCPICGNLHTGKLSNARYFCSNCSVEIFLSRKKVLEIFTICEDGTINPIPLNV